MAKSKVTKAVEKNDKLVAEITKLRDNNTCSICNKTKEKDGVTLHYHHAVKTKRASFQLRFDSRNCVTLCSGCHFKIHGDSSMVWVDYWRAKFRTIISLALEDDLIVKHNTGTLKRNLGSMAELNIQLKEELKMLKNSAVDDNSNNIYLREASPLCELPQI